MTGTKQNDLLTRLENGLADSFNSAARTVSNVWNNPLSLFQGSSHQAAHKHPASRFSASMYLDPANPHQFNIPTWLLFVKTEGPALGLGGLANHIHLTRKNGQYAASVDDPAVLRQIAALRHDKHLTGQLANGYRAHHNNVFPIVTAAGANTAPDPVLAQDQRALMTLGFDLGIHKPDGIRNPLTDAALKEFAATRHPPLQPGALHAQLMAAEHQAKADSDKYTKEGIPNITPAVAFAIRNASTTVNMDYKYLMQVAQRESAFDPAAVPVIPAHRDKHHHLVPEKKGGALGLYQFEPITWLSEIQMNGAKYGLGHLAAQVVGDASDATIRDPAVRNYALSLRNDPRLNALMGAELQRENQDAVARIHPDLKTEPAALYSMHMLGGGAGGTGGQFLSALKSHPNSTAADTLPPAAVKNNRNVFYDGMTALTNLEVFKRMQRSFGGHAFDAAPQLNASNRAPHNGGSTPS